MRKTNISHEELKNRITVTSETLAEILDCGRVTAVKIGTDAGARVKIGRRVVYVVSKVEEYMEALAESKKE